MGEELERTAAPVDYDEIYRGQSPFRELVGERPPWDIGEPQPAIAGLEAAGEIVGDVLDAGCGLGHNAMFLARAGHRVTAFDIAPSAISQASEHARSHGCDVEFRVANATSLPDFGRRFDTIVDSALYHCLPPAERRRYLSALGGQAKPGGLLHLLCFSDARPSLGRAAYNIGESELRSVTALGWQPLRLQEATITTALTLSAIKRSASTAGLEADKTAAAFTTDGQGRFLAWAWLLTARRGTEQD